MELDRYIFVITTTTFPCGGAATMRKLSLSKGFIYHGFTPIVLLLTDKDNQIVKYGIEYTYEGIKYINCAPFKWSKSVVYNLLSFFSAVITTAFIIIKRSSTSSIIWINNENFFLNMFYKTISKFSKAIYITEINENPFFFYESKCYFMRKLSSILLPYSLASYDYIFTMTYALADMLKLKINKLKYQEIIVVHNTVDFNRFHLKNIATLNYITYVGSLFVRKEGLDILIASFSCIKDEFRDFKLRIIGHNNEVNLKEVVTLLVKYNVYDRTEILLDVDNKEIPKLLCESYLLAITRERNSQTDYGFPTKLVEYLASSRPVLTTAVSDIPIFLTDGISAYIPEEITIDSVTEKLRQALNNERMSNAIGLNGKDIAFNYFNYITESRKMIFLTEKH